MKKKIIQILCILIFVSAILTIGISGIQLADTLLGGGNPLSNVTSIEKTLELAVTFGFSFLELKAGITLHKAIKSEDKFEWYKAFPGLLSAIIAPVALSYFTNLLAEFINSTFNGSEMIFNPTNLFVLIPLLIVLILGSSMKQLIAKRQTLPFNVVILINALLTLVLVVINKETFVFTSNIFDILSTIANMISIILITLVITYSILNIKDAIKDPDYLEIEAREHEVVEVLKEDEKSELVKIYSYKSPNPEKTKLPKVLLIISCLIFITYGAYYLFAHSLPSLSKIDFNNFFNSDLLGSLSGVLSLLMAFLIPMTMLLGGAAYLTAIFKPEPMNRYSMSALSSFHLFVKLPIYTAVIIGLIDVITSFTSSFNFEVFTTIPAYQILYIAPYLLNAIISSFVKKRQKYINDNIKNGDSFYEYRKDAGLTSIRSFLITAIPCVTMLIFEKDSLFNNVVYVIMLIASLLATIALIIQMKYPMDEFVKVRRRKIKKVEIENNI